MAEARFVVTDVFEIRNPSSLVVVGTLDGGGDLRIGSVLTEQSTGATLGIVGNESACGTLPDNQISLVTGCIEPRPTPGSVWTSSTLPHGQE